MVGDRVSYEIDDHIGCQIRGIRIGMIEERLLVGCFQNECKDYSFYDDSVKSDNIQILEGVVHDFHQQVQKQDRIMSLHVTGCRDRRFFRVVSVWISHWS